jgi:hypothetical protein
MKTTSEFISDETSDQTKFSSLEGQRIGDMSRKVKNLYDDYVKTDTAFKEKQ